MDFAYLIGDEAFESQSNFSLKAICANDKLVN